MARNTDDNPRLSRNRLLVGLESFVLRHRLRVSIAIHALLFILSLLIAYVVRFEISDHAVRETLARIQQSIPQSVRQSLAESQGLNQPADSVQQALERSFSHPEQRRASAMLRGIQQEISALAGGINWFGRFFLPWLPIVLAVKLLIFGKMRLYRGAWHYSSIRDVGNIVVASWAFLAIMIVALYGARALLHATPGADNAILGFVASQPTGVLLLDFVATVFVTCTARLGFRLYHEEFRLRPQSSEGVARVLVIGASNAAEVVIREISRMTVERYQVVGLIEDNPDKQGMVIYGAPVLGKTGDIPRICEKQKIDELLIAMPGAPHKELRRVIELCEGTKLRYRHLPGVTELIDGKVSVSQIKPVDINDLLGREAVELDTDSLERFLKDRTVLITGAGGSIGSELCRQVCHFAPGQLVLLEQAENPLFDIQGELSKSHPELPVTAVVCDIYDASRVRDIWARHKPEVVIHAAAHKHVPLMEANPCEAIKNNILGTRNVAEASRANGVAEFVMVSTDKAVNPSSIMGASKRVAELYTQSLNGRADCRTQFKAVRFGNVLGSNGSVVPTFRRQIDAGGPVTVTHPEMRRYFMTIPEASQLVLQAAASGQGGQIFLLDMGEPVRIVDLARTMITLSGLRPGEDIDIVFTGVRPGEKLFEKLRIDGEQVEPTVHPKIRIWRSPPGDPAQIRQAVEALEQLRNSTDRQAIQQAIRQIVPEYRPGTSETDPSPEADPKDNAPADSSV